MDNSVLIIAEAGVNHNGNRDMAFQLVDIAAEAGVDVIKFQTFKADQLVTQNASKAEYQKQNTGTQERQLDMLKKLELSYDLHYNLVEYCEKKDLQFLSTPFDFVSLDFLVNELKQKTLKLSSGEITNGPFLYACAKTGCNILISTGMSSYKEIEIALGVIAFGLTGGKNPNQESFKDAYESQEGKSVLKEKVTLLHCTSDYPAPITDINLRAIPSLQSKYGLKVGFSDHSEGIVIPAAAVAAGAEVIEKHFTISKKLHGPDHLASLDPEELKEMVRAIRTVETALGDGVKKLMQSECQNRKLVRKSIVAARDIKKGEPFTEDNITVKRPGDGRTPMEYWDILGNLASKRFNRDEAI